MAFILKASEFEEWVYSLFTTENQLIDRFLHKFVARNANPEIEKMQML